MTRLAALGLVSVLAFSGCHPGAIVDTDPKPSVGGTIAGVVRSGTTPITARHVTAINTTSGARFDATTGENGGYTIKVPEGTYRIELETKQGETLAKHPDDTRINNGDLDSARDFEVRAP